MKRFFLMLLAIGALGLVFGGACGKDKKKDGEGTEDEQAAKTTDEEGEEAAEEEGEEEEVAEEEAAEGEEEEAAEEGAEGETVATGVEACDALIKTAMECDKLPDATREAYKKAAEGWAQAIEAGGDQAKKTIEQSCTQAKTAWEKAFESAGC